MTIPTDTDAGRYPHVVACGLCGYTAAEYGLIAASTLAMLHHLDPRCCPSAHVCVRPAVRRWTSLGDLVTVPAGPCVDADTMADGSPTDTHRTHRTHGMNV